MKQFAYIFIAAVTLLAVSACSNHGDEPTPGGTYQKIQLTPTEKQITVEGNTFAFNLFKTFNEGRENENTFISPFSMAQVLAMLANGAQGETYDEIVKVLGISQDITEVNNYYKHLCDSLPKCAPESELTTTNLFVYNNRQNFFDGFMNTCTKYYGTLFNGADFDSSNVADIVNKWVSNATNGKIPCLFDNLAAISFCVVNATSFNGWWAEPFDKKETRNSIFHNYKNISERVPMMYQDIWLEHYTDSDYVSLLKIPYKGKNFEMDILLPNRNIDINEYISELNLDDFNYMLDNASTDSYSGQIYTVGLPKFSGKFNYNMRDPLMKMGINKAFFPGADFGKITTEKATVFDTRQSAAIDVDEHGTKVAVATGASDGYIACLWDEFIVDSPFIYIIRECSSGATLFIGKTVSIKQFSY